MEIPPTLLKCCIIGESNWDSWENILFLSWSWTKPAIFSIALVRCNLQQLSCDWCLHSCRDLSSPHLRFYPLPAGRVSLFTGLYLVAQIYKFWNPRFTINKTNSYKTLAIIWMCKSHKSFIFGSNPSSMSCKYMRRCCIDIIRASPLQDVTDHCRPLLCPTCPGRLVAVWGECGVCTATTTASKGNPEGVSCLQLFDGDWSPHRFRTMRVQVSQRREPFPQIIKIFHSQAQTIAKGQNLSAKTYNLNIWHSEM